MIRVTLPWRMSSALAEQIYTPWFHTPVLRVDPPVRVRSDYGVLHVAAEAGDEFVVVEAGDDDGEISR
jgi:hypothetical protein